MLDQHLQNTGTQRQFVGLLVIMALFTFWLYVTGIFTIINAVESSINGQDIPCNTLTGDDPSRTQLISTLHRIPSIEVTECLHDTQTRAYGLNLIDDTFHCSSMCAISRKQCILAVTDCAKQRLISTEAIYDDIHDYEETYSFPRCFHHSMFILLFLRTMLCFIDIVCTGSLPDTYNVQGIEQGNNISISETEQAVTHFEDENGMNSK